MYYLKLIGHSLAIIALTILTQTGGLIYIITLVIRRFLKTGFLKNLGIFLGIYLFFSFVIIPIVAPIFGRTSLPHTGNLRPLNYGTVILNRHYVDADLKNQLIEISEQMNSSFEGTKTNYLDANFPFFDGFPLIPHLSHNDGKKVDLAFYYKKDGVPSNTSPSFLGYGICEEPKNAEQNYPEICQQKGYWQYNILSTTIPQGSEEFNLDVLRTRALIMLLAEHESTSKIFIEPHLKVRWKLNRYHNIRFHGCQAVRHDDHIHTQIK